MCQVTGTSSFDASAAKLAARQLRSSTSANQNQTGKLPLIGRVEREVSG